MTCEGLTLADITHKCSRRGNTHEAILLRMDNGVPVVKVRGRTYAHAMSRAQKQFVAQGGQLDKGIVS